MLFVKQSPERIVPETSTYFISSYSPTRLDELTFYGPEAEICKEFYELTKKLHDSIKNRFNGEVEIEDLVVKLKNVR